MENRLNLDTEVRELKLGSTFTDSRPRQLYHTLKYDFKPASVDINKQAKLDVSSNNQVTVTVPHLDTSGVPNTVFKGNQRDYTKKECVLIINRATGEITLEKLHSNIQVKKTRIENKNINPPPMPMKMENQTARHHAKTKVSTGARKNTISYVPKHSPLPGSPSYPHKSPQSAPAWNANNTQQTLPSIPLIGLDDGNDFLAAPTSSVAQQQQHTINNNNNINHNHNSNNNSSHNNNTNIDVNMMPSSAHNTQQRNNTAIDCIGELSSSESSSADSESSDSGSDSDSTENNSPTKRANTSDQHMNNNKPLPEMTLADDLCLSESNSDDD